MIFPVREPLCYYYSMRTDNMIQKDTHNNTVYYTISFYILNQKLVFVFYLFFYVSILPAAEK